MKYKKVHYIMMLISYETNNINIKKYLKIKIE